MVYVPAALSAIVATGFRPESALLYGAYANNLADAGKPAEARDWYHKALAREPADFLVLKQYRLFCIEQGRPAEAIDAWEKSLSTRPVAHDEWYGCAEYCLFHGRQDKYRWARHELPDAFASTSNLHEA